MVLILNALIGFATEMRAIKSMEELRKLGQTTTRVIRDGCQSLVASKEIVPGDVIWLEAGDVVSSDARLLDCHNLSIDESTLTGESLPVEKSLGEGVEEHTNLSARTNMLMKGTHVTTGVARALVTSTGMNTELGKIAQLTADAKEEVTPLEKRLDRLGHRLVWMTLAVSVLILISGLVTGKNFLTMLQTAIALAVATVPEGLPIVATMALAKGLWTMAKKNALINKLSAVETLGATTIVVTDKTGTLTENRMTVSEMIIDSHQYKVEFQKDTERAELYEGALAVSSTKLPPKVRSLLAVLAGCNDAHLSNEREGIGDPMELALLRLALGLSESPSEVASYRSSRVSEVPFDSSTKMMATIHKEDGKSWVAVKGAPEAVLVTCTLPAKEQEYWSRQNQQLASRGLRVLGIAYKEDFSSTDEVYQGLHFLGLVGLIDPHRKDVPMAIQQCRQAGLRVIMATGDQAGTAVKIAKDIGLSDQNCVAISGVELEERWDADLRQRLDEALVFSRVSPEHKLQLVKYFQNQGHIVAMTGDGVNDAPALKKADIGVAMGLRGTQVARESADMILKDDQFSTIVHAIEQGRIVFSNIRRFVVYLLSCNISEVFVVSLASLFTSQLPITPLQILFLNLVTDVFPALALGMGKGESSYLSQPPRKPAEKILENKHWQFIFIYGGLTTFTVLGVYYFAIMHFEFSAEKAITLAFLTLGLCIFIFIVSIYTPALAQALSLVPLNFTEWIAVVLVSCLPFVGQLFIRMD